MKSGNLEESMYGRLGYDNHLKVHLMSEKMETMICRAWGTGKAVQEKDEPSCLQDVVGYKPIESWKYHEIAVD